jgi:hypothetical protein
VQAAGDETSDIFVDLKNCGLQVWLLIKIHSPIGDEAFGPNRGAAGYDLNRCFHVEFMALVAKPYLTKVLGPKILQIVSSHLLSSSLKKCRKARHL